MLLALDTATARTSIALLGPGLDTVEVETVAGPGDLAVALIDELLAAQGAGREQLTRVAVGVGPGPYTSVRVGVMVALTIGMALGIPVVGVCSLDVIAREALDGLEGEAPDRGVAVATDARRKEIYWAFYDRQGGRIRGPAVTKPADLLAEPEATGFAWAGNGFARYQQVVADHGLRLVEPTTPSAAVLARIAAEALDRGQRPTTAKPSVSDHATDGSGAVEPDAVLLAPHPLYLRRPDAALPAPGTLPIPGALLTQAAPPTPTARPTGDAGGRP